MKTVCVIFGGASSEHEVSLRSAATVLRSVPPGRFKALCLGITKEGKWFHYTGPAEEIEAGGWEQEQWLCPAVLSPDSSHKGVLLLEEGNARVLPVDVVFPVLHGKNGEDGTMQGLLELAGIPYVGCGVLASALCMDKELAHTALVAAGIPKTKLVALRPRDMGNLPLLEQRLSRELGYPMFIKPANAGSSIGVTKVKAPQELKAALELAFLHDSKAVAEKAMFGREVECAVMGGEEPVASAVVGEIAPPDGVYDYNAKYVNNEAGLYIPARIPEQAAQRVRELAVKAYRAAGCSGLSRVDFFVMDTGEVMLNEINTIPGFTSISMYPKLFEASGLPVSALVEKLLDGAAHG